MNKSQSVGINPLQEKNNKVFPYRLSRQIILLDCKRQKKSGRAGNKRAVLRYKIAKPKATEKWDYPFELLSARRKDSAKWA